MLEYYSSNSTMPFEYESSSNDDSDNYDRDPGRDVIEKNLRNRLQRFADYTKEELNKVLKRVDNTLNNYEYSVQASLIQHGMTGDDMSNVEHVADIKELENLLNDSLAKQRYKQRLMIFIVGQTEQVSEKAKLLQQIGQFFSEQKQSFSAREFDTYDDNNEVQDEVDITLKSFDVKDCYVHVKTLGTRLNELNEEIIQYLILNAGSKQQAKGKKKLVQVAKETKEQLASLQSKLEIANTEMINRDNKIEKLEKEIETIHNQTKINEDKLYDQLQRYETEILSSEKLINELEDNIEQYKYQINDLTETLSAIRQSEAEETTDATPTNVVETEEKDDKSEETIVPDQIDEQEVPSITILNPIIKTPPLEEIDEEIQTSDQSNEISQQTLPDNIEDLNVLFNSNDGIDLNNITNEDLPTAFANLQKIAIDRTKELLKELEIKESTHNERIQNLQQQFDEHKDIYEKEHNDMIEQTNNAYQLQIKAQKAAEEAIVHLKSYISEQETLKPDLIHQETQTDEQESLDNIISSPEHTTPVRESSNDRLSPHPKITTDEFESVENFRQTSLKEKYVSLIDEKKQELEQLKQQAEIILSRPTSIKERITFQPSENSAFLSKQVPSFSSFDSSNNKENRTEVESIIKQDQQQQTSFVGLPRSSTQEEKTITQMIQSDQYKLPFFHLYEIIYQFRHSIINLLEQNNFLSLADCLQMIKQLSSNDNHLTNDFLENAEHVLKDTIKILQTCISTFQTKINEYQIKELVKEPETMSSIDHQQSSFVIEQQESVIIDLTIKYEHLTSILNQVKIKNEVESNQNEQLIIDQQKLIQNLQYEIVRLQKRLIKIETEGITEPSIMFTRLDAERNEQTLQQAVDKGKVSETTSDELNEVMTDYVELPSQQFINLVKRYIHFRKAIEIENRIQSEQLDNDTKNVLEKMELLYARRSEQMGKRMLDNRQQRENLARILTEKCDHVENESSIFLIRPIYSYQGRTAVQSYLKEEKRRREVLLKANGTKTKHPPSRQSVKSRPVNNQQNGNQQMLTPLSSPSTFNDEERVFRIEKSLPPSRSSTNGQRNRRNDTQQKPIKLNELTRLQELDIQRALMPMSHVTSPLLPGFTNNGIDPCVPSLNLRSYVSLSRSGYGNILMAKPNDIITPASRERLSVLSAKSRASNPRTPVNSSVDDLRRVGPTLPPIKRSLTSSTTSVVNERQHSGLVPFVKTNEVATTE